MIKQNELGNLQLMSARNFFGKANIIISEDENETSMILKVQKETEISVKVPIRKETLDYSVPEFLKANGFKHIRIDKFFYASDLLIESNGLVFGLAFVIEVQYKNSDNEATLIIFIPNYNAVVSIVERQKSKNILKIKYINYFWDGKELNEEIVAEKIYAIKGEGYVKNIEEIKDMLIV
jgi:hypothetical protein